jgi:hypothetical protein
MATYTKKVGHLAELAVKSFLEGSGYKVIPYGVEHTLREVVDLGTKAYAKLGLEEVIKTAPDFVVLSPDRESYWLVEVKYRGCWSELARSSLNDDFEPQVRSWKRLFAVIAIKSPAGQDGTTTSHIRVCHLFIRDAGGERRLNAYVKGVAGGKKWDEVQWDDLCPIEDVFRSCCQDAAGKQRVDELVQTIRKMPEDSLDNCKEEFRNAWQKVHGRRDKC